MRPKFKKLKTKTESKASVSFPPRIYQTLEEIANQQKVLLAWVVRNDAGQCAVRKWLLLVKRESPS